MPLSYAALSARASEGSLGPAKLILMMRAPSCADQLMPLRILNVVLSAGGRRWRRRHELQAAARLARYQATAGVRAMAPAMPVPWGWGFSGAPAASKRCATAPSRSG